MKKEEIIILNGKEYTLTLNRESYIRIEKICDIEKVFNMVEDKHIEEIDDNYNPFEEEIDFDKMEEEEKNKEDALKNLIYRSFFIWLYPVHKMNITEVQTLLNSCFKEEDGIGKIGELFGKFLRESIEIKNNYEQERKNLQAQINK